jgi:L-threonylcarbamoyladenylate synthase
VSRRYDCSDPADRALGLREAAAAIRRGELVVLPTDTVYGVAADAFTPDAVGALLDAKGRDRKTPVPVLVGSPTTLHGIVSGMPQVGWELVDAFWPGSLTLVAMHQPSLRWDLGDTQGTVMVRMPLHPVAIELLNDAGPMAVSGANRGSSRPPLTVADAQGQLGDAVAIYLDGGPADQEQSTIVDVTGRRPRLLREGALSLPELREVVPDLEPVGAS